MKLSAIAKYGGIALIALGAANCGWKGEEINRLLAVNSLFDEDKIVYNFSHMGNAFLTTKIADAAPSPSPLPENLDLELSPGQARFVEEFAVTALVVSKDNALRFEEYYFGTEREDLRISWSVSKSFISTLLGILVEEGVIDNLDAKVTDYAPALATSAYSSATIRDVLQMESGVLFDESYLDPRSDINRMGRVVALGKSLDSFTAELDQSRGEAGKEWQYVSIDTHVIAMVMRGATGRSIADLMQEKLIGKLGFEGESYYITDGDGVAFALGGLNLQARDYLRFGQMIANGGTMNGDRIVSKAWIDEATRASANTQPGYFGYGYQWWVPPSPSQGEVFANGVYGQFIYIHPTKNVVIAMNSANLSFNTNGMTELTIRFFRSIVDDL